MPTIRELPNFREWLTAIKDKATRGAILARIAKLKLGLTGDAKSLGGGLHEARIHPGPGSGLYYVTVGAETIVLLVGGPTSTQASDINEARKLAESLDLSKGETP